MQPCFPLSLSQAKQQKLSVGSLAGGKIHSIPVATLWEEAEWLLNMTVNCVGLGEVVSLTQSSGPRAERWQRRLLGTQCTTNLANW